MAQADCSPEHSALVMTSDSPGNHKGLATPLQQVNSDHTLQIGDHCPVSIHKILLIVSSPVDQSTVEDGNDVAFIEVLNCSPPT